MKLLNCESCDNLRADLAFRTSQIADLERRLESVITRNELLFTQNKLKITPLSESRALAASQATIKAQAEDNEKLRKALNDAKTAIRGMNMVINGVDVSHGGKDARRIRHALVMAKLILNAPDTKPEDGVQTNG